MDFFDVVTTQRAIRRLKPDPIPEAVLRQIMDAAICAPSGGNRQGWSFLAIRDAATRARLGELYREAWDELMRVPYYAGAAKEPSDSPAGKMLASARHLGEHLGEAPVLVLACIALDPGVKPTVIDRRVHLSRRAEHHAGGARARHRKLHHDHSPVPRRAGEDAARHPGRRRDRRADTAGLPAREVRRPPRRPLREVAFADRWGQSF